MELDELKTLWKETDRRLQAMEPALRVSLSLNLRQAKAGALDRMRSKLRWVRLVLWYEVAFAALVLVLVGSYLFDHWDTVRFALPAAALHLGAIATLGVAVRQLLALGQIDHAGAVVDMQRRLAELGVVRARFNRWLLLSTPLLWALLVVVVPHGLVGLDVYRAFGAAWVAGNFVFGVAVLAAAAWFGRRAPAARSSPFFRALGEDLTGRRVAAAAGLLDEIAAFESEA